MDIEAKNSCKAPREPLPIVDWEARIEQLWRTHCDATDRDGSTFTDKMFRESFHKACWILLGEVRDCMIAEINQTTQEAIDGLRR
jgi:hypothetical protein